MATPLAMTPRQAAAALDDLPHVRDAVNNRAAALSWMMWALVIMSMVGSLLLLDKVPHEDGTDVHWGLFLLANIVSIGFWAAVGAGMQNAIWRAFTAAPADRRSAWKAPLLAFGTAFALVFANLALQGITRAMQGLDEGTRAMEDLHHNLGFAFTLGIGGAVVVSIAILLGARGFRRWPGVVAGIAMILAGHLTTFLWFPDLGLLAPLAAAAAIPMVFLAIGASFWRQG